MSQKKKFLLITSSFTLLVGISLSILTLFSAKALTQYTFQANLCGFNVSSDIQNNIDTLQCAGNGNDTDYVLTIPNGGNYTISNIPGVSRHALVFGTQTNYDTFNVLASTLDLQPRDQQCEGFIYFKMESPKDCVDKDGNEFKFGVNSSIDVIANTTPTWSFSDPTTSTQIYPQSTLNLTLEDTASIIAIPNSTGAIHIGSYNSAANRHRTELEKIQSVTLNLKGQGTVYALGGGVGSAIGGKNRGYELSFSTLQTDTTLAENSKTYNGFDLNAPLTNHFMRNAGNINIFDDVNLYATKGAQNSYSNLLTGYNEDLIDPLFRPLIKNTSNFTFRSLRNSAVIGGSNGPIGWGNVIPNDPTVSGFYQVIVRRGGALIGDVTISTTGSIKLVSTSEKTPLIGGGGGDTDNTLRTPSEAGGKMMGDLNIYKGNVTLNGVDYISTSVRGISPAIGGGSVQNGSSCAQAQGGGMYGNVTIYGGELIAKANKVASVQSSGVGAIGSGHGTSCGTLVAGPAMTGTVKILGGNVYFRDSRGQSPGILGNGTGEASSNSNTGKDPVNAQGEKVYSRNIKLFDTQVPGNTSVTSPYKANLIQLYKNDVSQSYTYNLKDTYSLGITNLQKKNDDTGQFFNIWIPSNVFGGTIDSRSATFSTATCTTDGSQYSGYLDTSKLVHQTQFYAFGKGRNFQSYVSDSTNSNGRNTVNYFGCGTYTIPPLPDDSIASSSWTDKYGSSNTIPGNTVNLYALRQNLYLKGEINPPTIIPEASEELDYTITRHNDNGIYYTLKDITISKTSIKRVSIKFPPTATIYFDKAKEKVADWSFGQEGSSGWTKYSVPENAAAQERVSSDGINQGTLAFLNINCSKGDRDNCNILGNSLGTNADNVKDFLESLEIRLNPDRGIKEELEISINDIPDFVDEDGYRHFYTMQGGNDLSTNWYKAYNNSQTLDLYGLKGYLATITSQKEDNVVKQFAAGRSSWISGTLKREKTVSDSITTLNSSSEWENNFRKYIQLAASSTMPVQRIGYDEVNQTPRRTVLSNDINVMMSSKYTGDDLQRTGDLGIDTSKTEFANISQLKKTVRDKLGANNWYWASGPDAGETIFNCRIRQSIYYQENGDCANNSTDPFEGVKYQKWDSINPDADPGLADGTTQGGITPRYANGAVVYGYKGQGELWSAFATDAYKLVTEPYWYITEYSEPQGTKGWTSSLALTDTSIPYSKPQTITSQNFPNAPDYLLYDLEREVVDNQGSANGVYYSIQNMASTNALGNYFSIVIDFPDTSCNVGQSSACGDLVHNLQIPATPSSWLKTSDIIQAKSDGNHRQITYTFDPMTGVEVGNILSQMKFKLSTNNGQDISGELKIELNAPQGTAIHTVKFPSSIIIKHKLCVQDPSFTGPNIDNNGNINISHCRPTNQEINNQTYLGIQDLYKGAAGQYIFANGKVNYQTPGSGSINNQNYKFQFATSKTYYDSFDDRTNTLICPSGENSCNQASMLYENGGITHNGELTYYYSSLKTPSSLDLTASIKRNTNMGEIGEFGTSTNYYTLSSASILPTFTSNIREVKLEIPTDFTNSVFVDIVRSKIPAMFDVTFSVANYIQSLNDNTCVPSLPNSIAYCIRPKAAYDYAEKDVVNNLLDNIAFYDTFGSKNIEGNVKLSIGEFSNLPQLSSSITLQIPQPIISRFIEKDGSSSLLDETQTIGFIGEDFNGYSIPSIQNYTFVSSNLVTGNSNPQVFTPQDNTTFTSKKRILTYVYARNFYTLTFNTSSFEVFNNALPNDKVDYTESLKIVTVPYGQTTTQLDFPTSNSASAPFVKGWKFLSWNTAPMTDNGDNSQCQGQQFNFASNAITSDTTLYTCFEKQNNVNIVFAHNFPDNETQYQNQGSLDNWPTNQNIGYGGYPDPTDSTPSEGGFTFDGWTLDGNTVINIASKRFFSTTTLYPKWSASGGKTISFNEGEFAPHLFSHTSPLSREVPSGRNAIAPDNEPQMVGYKFSGWYENSVTLGSTTCSSSGPNNEITFPFTLTNDMDAYLCMLPHSDVDIVFDMNGVTPFDDGGTFSLTTASYNSLITGLTNPKAVSYRFDSYWTTPDNSGTQINLSTFRTKSDTTISLFAHWTSRGQVAVIFDDSASKLGISPTISVSPISRLVNYNDTFAEPTTNPLYLGYQFKSWKTLPMLDASTCQGDDITFTQGLSQMRLTQTSNTFYACFEAKSPLNIIFNANTPTSPATSVQNMPSNKVGISYNDFALDPTQTPFALKYEFKGWFDNTISGSQFTSWTTSRVTSSKTLYARWEQKNDLDINYVLNPTSNPGNIVLLSGALSPSLTSTYETIEYNDIPSTPLVPIAEGFEFDSWRDQQMLTSDESIDSTEGCRGNQIQASTITSRKTANLTLYACWKRKANLTITFDNAAPYMRNGNQLGVNTPVSPTSSSVRFNGKVGSPIDNPQVTDWVFQGWFSDRTIWCDQDQVGLSLQICQSQNFNIEFGTRSYEDRIYDDTNTVPSRFSASKTLYAHYNFTGNLSILFDSNKPTSASSSIEGDVPQNGDFVMPSIGSTMPNPLNPRDLSLSGYNFKGWGSTKDSTQTFDFDNTIFDFGVTLFAIWEAKDTSITYIPNDSTNGIGSTTASSINASQSQKFDSFIPYLPNNIGRAGYTFSGFNTKSDNSGQAFTTTTKLSKENGVEFIGDEPKLTLYAIYIPKPHNLSFNCNRPSSSTDPCQGNVVSQDFLFDEEKTLPTSTYNIKGYDFIGWSTSPTGSTTTDVTFTDSSLTDVTHSTIVNYDPTFSSGQRVTYGVDFGLTPIWSTDPCQEDCGSSTFVPEIIGYTDQNTTLFAIYSIHKIQVSFDMSSIPPKPQDSILDSTNTFVPTQTIDFGKRVSSPGITPTIPGFEFCGWVQDANYKGLNTTCPDQSNYYNFNNVLSTNSLSFTLYPSFKPLGSTLNGLNPGKYSISFNSNLPVGTYRETEILNLPTLKTYYSNDALGNAKYQIGSYSIQNPTLKNNQFECWTLVKDQECDQDAASQTSFWTAQRKSSNITLYAKWLRNPYVFKTTKTALSWTLGNLPTSFNINNISTYQNAFGINIDQTWTSFDPTQTDNPLKGTTTPLDFDNNCTDSTFSSLGGCFTFDLTNINSAILNGTTGLIDIPIVLRTEENGHTPIILTNQIGVNIYKGNVEVTPNLTIRDNNQTNNPTTVIFTDTLTPYLTGGTNANKAMSFLDQTTIDNNNYTLVWQKCLPSQNCDLASSWTNIDSTLTTNGFVIPYTPSSEDAENNVYLRYKIQGDHPWLATPKVIYSTKIQVLPKTIGQLTLNSFESNNLGQLDTTKSSDTPNFKVDNKIYFLAKNTNTNLFNLQGFSIDCKWFQNSTPNSSSRTLLQNIPGCTALLDPSIFNQDPTLSSAFDFIPRANLADKYISLEIVTSANGYTTRTLTPFNWSLVPKGNFTNASLSFQNPTFEISKYLEYNYKLPKFEKDRENNPFSSATIKCQVWIADNSIVQTPNLSTTQAMANYNGSLYSNTDQQCPTSYLGDDAEDTTITRFQLLDQIFANKAIKFVYTLNSAGYNPIDYSSSWIKVENTSFNNLAIQDSHNYQNDGVILPNGTLTYQLSIPSPNPISLIGVSTLGKGDLTCEFEKADDDQGTNLTKLTVENTCQGVNAQTSGQITLNLDLSQSTLLNTVQTNDFVRAIVRAKQANGYYDSTQTSAFSQIGSANYSSIGITTPSNNPIVDKQETYILTIPGDSSNYFYSNDTRRICGFYDDQTNTLIDDQDIHISYIDGTNSNDPQNGSSQMCSYFSPNEITNQKREFNVSFSQNLALHGVYFDLSVQDDASIPTFNTFSLSTKTEDKVVQKGTIALSSPTFTNQFQYPNIVNALIGPFTINGEIKDPTQLNIPSDVTCSWIIFDTNPSITNTPGSHIPELSTCPQTPDQNLTRDITISITPDLVGKYIGLEINTSPIGYNSYTRTITSQTAVPEAEFLNPALQNATNSNLIVGQEFSINVKIPTPSPQSVSGSIKCYMVSSNTNQGDNPNLISDETQCNYDPTQTTSGDLLEFKYTPKPQDKNKFLKFYAEFSAPNFRTISLSTPWEEVSKADIGDAVFGTEDPTFTIQKPANLNYLPYFTNLSFTNTTAQNPNVSIVGWKMSNSQTTNDGGGTTVSHNSQYAVYDEATKKVITPRNSLAQKFVQFEIKVEADGYLTENFYSKWIPVVKSDLDNTNYIGFDYSPNYQVDTDSTITLKFKRSFIMGLYNEQGQRGLMNLSSSASLYAATDSLGSNQTQVSLLDFSSSNNFYCDSIQTCFLEYTIKPGRNLHSQFIKPFINFEALGFNQETYPLSQDTNPFVEVNSSNLSNNFTISIVSTKSIQGEFGATLIPNFTSGNWSTKNSQNQGQITLENSWQYLKTTTDAECNPIVQTNNDCWVSIPSTITQGDSATIPYRYYYDITDSDALSRRVLRYSQIASIQGYNQAIQSSPSITSSPSIFGSFGFNISGNAKVDSRVQFNSNQNSDLTYTIPSLEVFCQIYLSPSTTEDGNPVGTEQECTNNLKYGSSGFTYTPKGVDTGKYLYLKTRLTAQGYQGTIVDSNYTLIENATFTTSTIDMPSIQYFGTVATASLILPSPLPQSINKTHEDITTSVYFLINDTTTDLGATKINYGEESSSLFVESGTPSNDQGGLNNLTPGQNARYTLPIKSNWIDKNIKFVLVLKGDGYTTKTLESQWGRINKASFNSLALENLFSFIDNTNSTNARDALYRLTLPSPSLYTLQGAKIKCEFQFADENNVSIDTDSTNSTTCFQGPIDSSFVSGVRKTENYEVPVQSDLDSRYSSLPTKTKFRLKVTISADGYNTTTIGQEWVNLGKYMFYGISTKIIGNPIYDSTLTIRVNIPSDQGVDSTIFYNEKTSIDCSIRFDQAYSATSMFGVSFPSVTRDETLSNENKYSTSLSTIRCPYTNAGQIPTIDRQRGYFDWLWTPEWPVSGKEVYARIEVKDNRDSIQEVDRRGNKLMSENFSVDYKQLDSTNLWTSPQSNFEYLKGVQNELNISPYNYPINGVSTSSPETIECKYVYGDSLSPSSSQALTSTNDCSKMATTNYHNFLPYQYSSSYSFDDISLIGKYVGLQYKINIPGFEPIESTVQYNQVKGTDFTGNLTLPNPNLKVDGDSINTATYKVNDIQTVLPSSSTLSYSYLIADSVNNSCSSILNGTVITSVDGIISGDNSNTLTPTPLSVGKCIQTIATLSKQGYSNLVYKTSFVKVQKAQFTSVVLSQMPDSSNFIPQIQFDTSSSISITSINGLPTLTSRGIATLVGWQYSEDISSGNIDCQITPSNMITPSLGYCDKAYGEFDSSNPYLITPGIASSQNFIRAVFLITPKIGDSYEEKEVYTPFVEVSELQTYLGTTTIKDSFGTNSKLSFIDSTFTWTGVNTDQGVNSYISPLTPIKFEVTTYALGNPHVPDLSNIENLTLNTANITVNDSSITFSPLKVDGSGNTVQNDKDSELYQKFVRVIYPLKADGFLEWSATSDWVEITGSMSNSKNLDISGDTTISQISTHPCPIPSYSVHCKAVVGGNVVSNASTNEIFNDYTQDTTFSSISIYQTNRQGYWEDINSTSQINLSNLDTIYFNSNIRQKVIATSSYYKPTIIYSNEISVIDKSFLTTSAPSSSLVRTDGTYTLDLTLSSLATSSFENGVLSATLSLNPQTIYSQTYTLLPGETTHRFIFQNLDPSPNSNEYSVLASYSGNDQLISSTLTRMPKVIVDKYTLTLESIEIPGNLTITSQNIPISTILTYPDGASSPDSTKIKFGIDIDTTNSKYPQNPVDCQISNTYDSTVTLRCTAYFSPIPQDRLTQGNHLFTFAFNGDSNFEPLVSLPSLEQIFNVEKVNSSIFVNLPTTISRSDNTVSVFGTVQANGISPTGSVKLKVIGPSGYQNIIDQRIALTPENQNCYSGTCVSNAYFTTIPNVGGRYYVEAFYEGDNSVKQSNPGYSSTISVVNNATDITLSDYSTQLTILDTSFTLRGSLSASGVQDEFAQGILSAKLYDSTNTYLRSTTLDITNSGNFYFDFDITGITAGTYTVKLDYQGSPDQVFSPVSLTSTTTVLVPDKKIVRFNANGSYLLPNLPGDTTTSIFLNDPSITFQGVAPTPIPPQGQEFKGWYLATTLTSSTNTRVNLSTKLIEQNIELFAIYGEPSKIDGTNTLVFPDLTPSVSNNTGDDYLRDTSLTIFATGLIPNYPYDITLSNTLSSQSRTILRTINSKFDGTLTYIYNVPRNASPSNSVSLFLENELSASLDQKDIFKFEIARIINLKFNKNDSAATGTMSDITVTDFNKPASLTLPSNTFTKPSYTFIHWTSELSDGTHTYLDNSDITVSAENTKNSTSTYLDELTFKANYEISDFTLSIDYGNHGLCSISSNPLQCSQTGTLTGDDGTISNYYTTSAKENDDLESVHHFVKDPTDTGWTFDGWFLTQSFTPGTEFDATTTTLMPKNDLTLYAKWTQINYTLKVFREIQGSTYSNININNAHYADPLTNYGFIEHPQVPGWTFEGWFTNSSMTSPWTVSTKMPASSLTLYAKYSQNYWDLYIDYNGHGRCPLDLGCNGILKGQSLQNIDVNDVTYDEVLQDRGFYKEPIEPGWTFDGWYRDEQLSLNKKFDITNTTNMPDASLSLWAGWTQNDYNFEVYYNDSVITPSPSPSHTDISIANAHFDDTLTNFGFESSPTASGWSFDGWYKTPNFLPGTEFDATNTLKMPADNLSIYAKWTQKNFNFDVHYNDSTITSLSSPVHTDISTSTAHFDETLASLGFDPNPSVQGWTFGGWYLTPNFQTGSEFDTTLTLKMPDSNLELFAKWTENNYDFKVHYNDSTITPLPSPGHTDITKTNAHFDETLASLGFESSPTASGWTFDGWYLTNDFQPGSEFDTTVTTNMPDSNLELFAKWTQNNYNFEVYYNDSAITPTPSPSHTDITIANAHFDDTLSNFGVEFSPTASGWTFDGWYTTIDFQSGSEFNPTSTLKMPDTNLSIYAKWTQKNFNFEVHYNDSTITPTPSPSHTDISTSTAHFDETLASLGFDTNPTAQGWTFEGWYLTSNFQTGSEFDTTVTLNMPESNLELYAKWTQNNYDFKVHYNDSTITPLPSPSHTDITRTNAHFDETLASLGFESSPTAQGWTFDGWYLTNDFQPGSEFDTTVTTNMPDSNLELFAKWTQNNYNFEVHYNDSVITPSPSPSHSDLTIANAHFDDTLSNFGFESSPTAQGWTFDGWYTTIDFQTGSEFDPTSTPKMPDSNLIIYAKWTQNGLNFYVHYNDSVITPTPSPSHTDISISTAHFDETLVSLGFDPSPTAQGWTFNGWYLTPNFITGTEFDATTTLTMPDSNLELFAKWTQNNYTFSLQYNLPASNQDYTNTYKTNAHYGEDLINYGLVNSPTASNYTFNGWFTTPNFDASSAFDPTLNPTMPDSSLSLYASWDYIGPGIGIDDIQNIGDPDYQVYTKDNVNNSLYLGFTGSKLTPGTKYGIFIKVGYRVDTSNTLKCPTSYTAVPTNTYDPTSHSPRTCEPTSSITRALNRAFTRDYNLATQDKAYSPGDIIPIGNTIANSQGEFLTQFKIPSDTPVGDHTIIVSTMLTQSYSSSHGTLVEVSSPQRLVIKPLIDDPVIGFSSLEPSITDVSAIPITSIQNGLYYTYTGNNLNSATKYSLYIVSLDSAISPTTSVFKLGSVIANNNSQFTTQFQFPRTLELGKYEVVLTKFTSDTKSSYSDINIVNYSNKLYFEVL